MSDKITKKTEWKSHFDIIIELAVRLINEQQLPFMKNLSKIKQTDQPSFLLIDSICIRLIILALHLNLLLQVICFMFFYVVVKEQDPEQDLTFCLAGGVNKLLFPYPELSLNSKGHQKRGT